MGSNSWNPDWEKLDGKLLFNSKEKIRFGKTKDFAPMTLEKKNSRIVELEEALEEEKRKAAKNERDKAKLKEDKEKHKIADKKLKDLRHQLEIAKNKNDNNNNNENGWCSK